MVITNESRSHLLAADTYRLLSAGLSYPDNEMLKSVESLTTELLKENELPAGVIAKLQAFAGELNDERIAAEYSRIFIQGGVPVTESHTVTSFNSVSDVAAFYAAFGFEAKSGESPDSIMYELEFMALLNIKIAIAPNQEARSVTFEAYHDFLKEHLLEFSQKFSKKILSGDAIPYFKLLCELLVIFVEGEAMLAEGEN